MKTSSRILIAVSGALAIHALAAVVLKRSTRYGEVYFPQNSIEIVAEGTDKGAPVQATTRKSSDSAPEPVSASVPATGSSQSGTSGPSGSAVNTYLTSFRDRLSAKIRPPRGMHSQLQLILKVTLLESGEVKAFAIDQSSGSPDFDRAVLEALDQAKPFPPFSREFAGMHELSVKVPVVLRAR